MLDDVEYAEKFVKENDYTLSQVRTGTNSETGVQFASRITRTFNFLAQQVTTMTRDITYKSYGDSSSVATTLTVQRFDEFQSDAEIRLMHEKLKQKGGRPPALEDAPVKPRIAPPATKGLEQ